MSLWYRCAEPERPTDPYVMWHYRMPADVVCAGCAIGAEVQRRLHPDNSHVAWLCDHVIGRPSD